MKLEKEHQLLFFMVLMGGLSNFNGVVDYFHQNGYKVIIPELPLYTQNILKQT